MFNEARFREMLLSSSGIVNGYVKHIFLKNMQTFMETIELPNLDGKKLRNATN